MLYGEYKQLCIITNEHCVCCDVRLHCFLIYEETFIIWGMTHLTVYSSTDGH